MKDVLDGVTKVKKIMDNMTVFVCRKCGLSYDKHNKAKRCCMAQVRNKSGHFTQFWRNV